jgi:hypothetical protein
MKQPRMNADERGSSRVRLAASFHFPFVFEIDVSKLK